MPFIIIYLLLIIILQNLYFLNTKIYLNLYWIFPENRCKIDNHLKMY